MKPSILFSPSSWRKKKKPSPSHREKVLPSFPTDPFARRSPSTYSEGTDFDSLSDSSTIAYPESWPQTKNTESPPRRPRRPSNLDLQAPPLESSTSCPLSPTSPRTTHDIFAPPLSPSYSCPSSQAEFEPSHSSSTLLKSKRSMPQLDGVWKGFLEEVNEDPRSLQTISRPVIKREHQRSTSQHHAQLAGVSRSRSKSTHDLSLASSRNAPPVPTTSSSKLPPGSDEGDLTVDLLSFPTPPPLFIRRKVPPLPALRPTPSVARLPPSPPMNSSASSSDSTPVTTPRTATPQNVTAVSVLNSPSSSVASFDPISAIPPSHFPNSPDSHSRRLRLVQSVSHLPSGRPHPAAHRITSSDTVGTRSKCASRSRYITAVQSEAPIPEYQYPYPYSTGSLPDQTECGIGIAF